MKWFGLTGGIASGKSTVAAMFREHGFALIDADVVAREVVAPGAPALAQLVEAFGADILTPEGALDRAALGARVFSDPDARRQLNAITHPAIGARTAEHMQALREGGAPCVIYDAALIVENGLHHAMDGLVVVHVPMSMQRSRLIARDGLSEEAAQQRLDAQLDPEAKVKVATWVIDNSGTLDNTRAQVGDVAAVLRELSAG